MGAAKPLRVVRSVQIGEAALSAALSSLGSRERWCTTCGNCSVNRSLCEAVGAFHSMENRGDFPLRLFSVFEQRRNRWSDWWLTIGFYTLNHRGIQRDA